MSHDSDVIVDVNIRTCWTISGDIPDIRLLSGILCTVEIYPNMATGAPPTSGGSAGGVGNVAKFGVLTVSDRASAGIYDDLSGPAILQFFAEAIKSECVSLRQSLLGIEQGSVEADLSLNLNSNRAVQIAAHLNGFNIF